MSAGCGTYPRVRAAIHKGRCRVASLIMGTMPQIGRPTIPGHRCCVRRRGMALGVVDADAALRQHAAVGRCRYAVRRGIHTVDIDRPR